MLVHSLARPRARRRTRWLAPLALCLPTAACTYDVDKLFGYAAQTTDGGTEEDAGAEPLPAELIDLWEEGALSEECIACAKQKCADVSATCRDDAECAELTRCVAGAENPAEQYDCRAEHAEWLAQSIQQRDIGGPYQQCVFLSSCVSECESHTQLACTGTFNWPMAQAGASVPLHLRFVEGLNATPVAGLSVRACQAEFSAECNALDDGEYLTDEDGVVHLEVVAALGSFQGYLELSGAGIYPTLLRFGWPIARETVTNVAVISRANVSGLVFSSGEQLDEDRGLLQLRAFGCNGITSRDISFSVTGGDEASKTWYTVGQDLQPIFNADVTSDRGAGGIVNVPEGRRQVTASHGEEVITSLSAPVRAGHMTIVVMLPGG